MTSRIKRAKLSEETGLMLEEYKRKWHWSDATWDDVIQNLIRLAEGHHEDHRDDHYDPLG
jgi:hypothetical protein